MRAVITGTGHYAPEERLTNHDLEKMVDTNDEWITTRTGIKERRILAKDKGVSYMAVRSAEMALEQAGASPSEVDLIILATVTPDMPVPSAAAIVQKDLGAENCWGFDVNGGCTGFLFALATASQFVETGKHRKVLAIGADKMSSIIDYRDRNTCVIFGDGAGAALVEPSDDEETGVADYDLHMDGTGSQYLNVRGGGSLHPASPETVGKNMHCIHQDGKTVFKHAVNGMTSSSLNLIEKNGLSGDDISLFIPHQANQRIIDAVSKKVKLDPKKVVVNIAGYGNTTAGTIPIALSEARLEKRMSKGDWILMSAFGAGFTWGSLLLKWAVD